MNNTTTIATTWCVVSDSDKTSTDAVLPSDADVMGVERTMRINETKPAVACRCIH